MPRNVEIKAVLRDVPAAHATAARLSGASPRILLQEDVFFPCKGARLKLRILSPDQGELIRYERADEAKARRSVYWIAPTSDPQTLRAILTATLGVSGVVSKRRSLYLVGQTRVHVDEVEGLGDFLELEVVMRADQTDAEGKQILAELLSLFGIGAEQVLPEAYVDLLARQRKDRHSANPV